MRMHSIGRLGVVLGFVFAFLLAVPEARADRATELKAREAFASGRYDDALNLFAKLYAETLHPVYLRNIGRCHQKMRQPDKAIDKFNEYLAKEKKISADERKEIEGYIKEMEDLKRQREAPPPPPPVTTTPARVPPPVINEPLPPPHVVSVPPPPPEESAPVYKRWWFWTAVGVAVAAGTVGVLAATGTFKSGSKDPACEAGRLCQ